MVGKVNESSGSTVAPLPLALRHTAVNIGAIRTVQAWPQRKPLVLLLLSGE